MTIREIPKFKTAEKNQLLFTLESNDFNFLGIFEDVLKRINGYNDLIAIVSRRKNDYTNRYLVYDSSVSKEAAAAYYLSLTLASYYNGNILDAWKDGFDNLRTKMQIVGKGTIDMDLVSPFIENTLKLLVTHDLIIANLPRDPINLAKSVEETKQKLSSFIEEISNSRRKARLSDHLELAHKYLAQIKQVSELLQNADQINNQVDKLLEFYRSSTLFNFDPVEIIPMYETMNIVSEKVIEDDTRNAICYANSLDVVKQLRF